VTGDEARRIVLVDYPDGMPDERHLRLEGFAPGSPGEGQVLLRTIYLSLDPYMRGRMSPVRSYADPVKPGEVMVGGTVSEVIESRFDGLQPGDIVLGMSGWQTHAVADGKGLYKLDPGAAPITTALGVLGMPGLTAYVGLLDHGKPKAGETVVVSAAAGAVGQVVGQLARIKGCRAIGIAGADDKCDYVVNELGFTAAVNYKADDYRARLKAACPHGVDIYFDNVGGPVAEAAASLFNLFGRMLVCGRISAYNAPPTVSGPDPLARFMGLTLTRRLTVRGFLVFDHADRRAAFLRDMQAWLKSGEVRYREDIVEGIERTVEAFQGLLTGRNRGKLIVKVGADPTLGET
jgi:NADPH-dependent curcumin reductase CurA